MLLNYSNKKTEIKSEDSPRGIKIQREWSAALILPVWVFISFYTAQACMVGIVWLLKQINIPLESLDPVVYNALVNASVYAITPVVAITGPWLLRKHITTKDEIGITRYPAWGDILMSISGLVIYFVVSSLLLYLATNVAPGFDVYESQDVGFKNLVTNGEFILAFLTLVVVAPFSEELLFRGYLYGKLRKAIPIWVAILATSLLFGALHGSWVLFIDTFALSVVLCLVRESTDSLWSSIVLHMIKNGIAFYLLFINPLFLSTLG